MGLFAALPAIVQDLDRVLNGETGSASVKLAVSPHRYPNVSKALPPFSANDYGFVITDFMLADVLAKPECDFLLVTNADNAYSKTFFPLALAEMDKGNDLVLLQFVSRYGAPSSLFTYVRAKFDKEVFFLQPSALSKPRRSGAFTNAGRCAPDRTMSLSRYRRKTAWTLDPRWCERQSCVPLSCGLLPRTLRRTRLLRRSTRYATVRSSASSCAILERASSW